jgi:hypothetical protein
MDLHPSAEYHFAVLVLSAEQTEWIEKSICGDLFGLAWAIVVIGILTFARGGRCWNEKSDQ